MLFKKYIKITIFSITGLSCLSGLYYCAEKKPFLDDPPGRTEVEETQTAANPILKLLPNTHTGIDFQNIILESDDDNFYTNNIKYNGGGLAIADVNNDGLQDIYFICTNGKNKLYLNQGGLKFNDITDAAGVGSEDGFETAATAVDINNDGWMDLYVCRAGVVMNDARRNRLFVNNGPSPAGNGAVTFTDKAAEYGLDDISASTSANFFDYDNDGDLDLYLLNHPSSGEYSNKFESTPGPDGHTLVPILEPKADYDSDHLFRNDTGKFTNVSKSAGIWNSAYGLSVSISDLNRDGYQDVYVANDFIRPDFYYVNNRNGTFTDRLKASFQHTSRHTMGTDLTDFDNDGLIDLYAVDMLPMNNYRLKTTKVTMSQSLYTTTLLNGYYEAVVRNVLQRNNGNGTFSDIGCLSGVYKTEWSWSGLLFDIDNDGWRDMHVTNGYRRNINDNDFFEYKYEELMKVSNNNLKSYFQDIDKFLRLIPTYKSRNCCFQNKGDWTFADKGGDWLTLPASWSNGSAWADLDNDGDLDLVTSNLEEQPFVYQNLSSDQRKNNYLQLRLHGSDKNRMAIGASAVIYYGNQKQYLELNPVRGIFSSVEYLLHFGLGNAAQVDKMVVRWPDGKTQTLTNVPANQRLELHYKDASGYVKHLVPLEPQTAYFQEKTAGAGLNWRHEENAFNDFETWPLNPFRETDHGPFLAAGDVNGDGLDDFFVGNSFDKPAALFLQTAAGGFKATNSALWEQEKAYEDHGATFFDADGDGDQDLYVVSGGMEAVNKQAWQDRLYLNDGQGNFSKPTLGLPAEQEVGGRVLAHDFDQDGDLDIIVGGRVTGAKWPLTPRSFILQNDGLGHFIDVTARIAPDFERCGMVTSLVAANLDQTPAPELIVCGEWMPITVFQFSSGKFIDVSDKFGFTGSDGIWSSLFAADLDGDGDQDLVSGNLGLNSRLSASAQAPLRVFAGDYDKNGTLDPVVTYPENGKNFPIVQKTVMHQQVPMIKKKYLFSQDYSRAGVDDIFKEKDLEAALNLFAYTLETVWWENQNGRFVQRKLPVQAQVAPVNAILFADFTGDNLPDLLLAGNKYGLEVETNRLDAGNGILLQGNGKGQFTFVENHVSGFWAPGEVRDMAALRGSGGKRSIVVANNHAPVQVFQVKKTGTLQ